MPNANTKKVIFVLIISALLFIVGCSSPEEKRTKSLAQAAYLQAAGDTISALELLEKLSQNYPDDSEVLQQIGLLQQELGNYTEAAFYLNAAHNLTPDDPDLLYQTYLAIENTDQPEAALKLLEVFAKTNPADMTGALWFRLGELREQSQKTESALEAYLEGIKLTNEKPSAEIALTIGTLFKQLNNLPMAGRWLAIAAQSDDPNALPALFGLLEIHLTTKNWESAEQCIVLLDKKFPGALDASEWAKSRRELKKRRAAQAEMKAQLERMAQTESETQAKLSKVSVKTTTTREPSRETSGKEQVVADIANAEALATSASETISEDKSETSADQAEPEIVFDPNIVIKPAEPDTDLNEPVDPQDQEAQFVTDYSTNYQSSATQSEPITEPDILSEPDTFSEQNTSLPNTPLLSLEELITRAKAATSRHNYEEAIQLYWDALGQTNKRADIWNALSEVYLIDGQAKNAVTTALEATRLSPENIDYVLDYLRVVQRVKKPADFIKELEIAYERFPRSPEITLSLARGYLKVGGNDYAAGILYRRFIQMAPNHPLRPEAEAALERIR